MVAIRNFKKADFEAVSGWWKTIGEHGPSIEQLPEESTFVLAIDDEPALCLAVYLTNTDIAYFENFISDPEFKGRQVATQALLEHAWSFARSKNYKYSVGFTTVDKLTQRYLDMGYDTKVNNVTILGKKL